MSDTKVQYTLRNPPQVIITKTGEVIIGEIKVDIDPKIALLIAVAIGSGYEYSDELFRLAKLGEGESKE